MRLSVPWGAAVAEQVRAVDVTLRDGQMSLWAQRMRTGMIIPIAQELDRAGFDAVEIIAPSFFKKCVRELKEDPFERLRIVSAEMYTPLRAIMNRHVAAFQMTSPAVSRLWLERLAANGVREVRVSDPSNTVENLKEQVRLAREVGLDVIVNLVFSVSPKHTDDYYTRRMRALEHVDATRFCLKDPSGLLQPERCRALSRAMLAVAGGKPVEIHNHCNTGLGSLCAIEAVEAGIRIVNTAIPPLSNGASLPSVFNLKHNLGALGYNLDVAEGPLRDVSEYLFQLAKRHGFPVGVPAEYDAYHYKHQVPGGMISNFKFQLQALGMSDRLPEVLEEIVAVRADLGYPIMVTPYSQFVGTQALMNVISGERYKEVTDEIISYVSGAWGAEEADNVDLDVKDKIMARHRAREIASRPPLEESLAELRQRLTGQAGGDDDELLLRLLSGSADVDAMRSVPKTDTAFSATHPLVDLVSGLARSQFSHIVVEGADLRLSLSRSRNKGERDTP